MTWKRLRLCALCLVLWPASIFAVNWMTGLVAPLLWWLLTKSGGTHSALTIFDTNALVPLALLEGLLLGLVPIASLRNLVVSALGFFRQARQGNSAEPIKPPQPFLWMWVLPAIVFLGRFVGFDSGGAGSVLGGHAITLRRSAYFFGPLTPLALSGRATVWSTDRILITTPMLFTAAYQVGVWLSGYLPRRPLAKEVTYDEVPAPANAETLGSSYGESEVVPTSTAGRLIVEASSV